MTCNALDGGTIVEPDKKVTINNPNAIKALEFAKGWVGPGRPVENGFIESFFCADDLRCVSASELPQACQGREDYLRAEADRN